MQTAKRRTKEEPCHYCMRVKSIRASDIAERELIQLRCASPTSGIYWEKDRPGYATPDKAKQYDGPEEP
jgi:hypothetical protein